ncbi:MAG: hypothetical protein HYV09_22520 [Deltaproteobacteria bacterium]|nr:hypothetical protein [Deltaproteobacteria bacterium]
MSALAMLLSAASSVLLLGSGYLYGARRGRAAREALARAHDAQTERNAALDRELARIERELARVERELARKEAPAVGGDVGALRDEVGAVMQAIAEQERSQDALRAELRQGLAGLAQRTADPDKLQRDLQKLMAPLLRRQDDTSGLRDMMSELLKPIVERDRLGKELSSVQEGEGLRELPRMLDAIAEKGSFATVVLSDDAGLPLAANRSAADVDALAAVASWLITLVHRAERSEAARPLSFVVHDSWNQHVIHRVFDVGAQRFTLTAVSRGMQVSPGTLDAALGKIERVLGAARN